MGDRALGSAARNARKVQDAAPVDYAGTDPEMAPVLRAEQRRRVAGQALGQAEQASSHGLEDFVHDAKGWAGRAWQGMKNAVVGAPKAAPPPAARYTDAEEAADYKKYGPK